MKFEETVPAVKIISGVNPFDNSCIVLDLFDIFFKFKEMYNFDFNLSRMEYANTFRFPSLIFQNKAASLEEIESIQLDFTNLIVQEIENKLEKNPNAENIIITWNRTSKEKAKELPYYQKVNVSELTDFIKINIDKFFDNLQSTIEVQKFLEDGLPCLNKKIKLSGSYRTSYWTISQDAIISYSGASEDTRPRPSEKTLKRRYGFYEIINPDPNITIPLIGFLDTVQVAEKETSAAFKESCTVFAFEMLKTISNLPESFLKDEIIEYYQNFVLNSTNTDPIADILEKNMDTIFRMKKNQYSSLFNGVSHSMRLIEILKSNKLNPDDFVCTRREEFVNGIKDLICKNPFIKISTALRDKVNPYDVLVLPKKIFNKAINDKQYLQEVQSIIANEFIENEAFLKGDDITINKNATIPYIAISLKERESLYGKSKSFFFPIKKKYSKSYIELNNIIDIDNLFTENNFTRGKNSLKILKLFEETQLISSYINIIEKNISKELAKRILIYGIHIKNKYDNNIIQLCKTETEKCELLKQLDNLDFSKTIECYGINDWRKYLRTSDPRRLINYKIRESDEIAYQAGKNKNILEKVSIEKLQLKFESLSYAALIQEFNEETLKSLINFAVGKNFGQIFVMLKGNIENKTIYPAKCILENKHLIGYDKIEAISHYKDFPDIKWNGNKSNTICELRDIFDSKETKIFQLPMQFDAIFSDTVTLSITNSGSRANISISDK